MSRRRTVNLQRRHVLIGGGVLAGCLAVGVGPLAAPTLRPRKETESRHIALHNLHTGEYLEVEYRQDHAYVPAALVAIERVLRDFRSGEQHTIDPALMDYLVDVAAATGAEPRFSVISGYRSPQTNEQLRERSAGVAQQSLHLQGRAIDVRLLGVDSLRLATRAQTMSRGGVGYYRKSDFVHLDTGAFRTWRG